MYKTDGGAKQNITFPVPCGPKWKRIYCKSRTYDRVFASFAFDEKLLLKPSSFTFFYRKIAGFLFINHAILLETESSTVSLIN